MLLCLIMPYAFLYLLCQKLCWHNVDIPTPVLLGERTMGRHSRHYFTLRRPLIFTSIVGRPATIEERRTSNVQPTNFTSNVGRPATFEERRTSNVQPTNFVQRLTYSCSEQFNVLRQVMPSFFPSIQGLDTYL